MIFDPKIYTKYLETSGYRIHKIEERNNNGRQLVVTFVEHNFKATIFEKDKRGNTVVQGKGDENEQNAIKSLIESIKWEEFNQEQHLTKQFCVNRI